MWMSTYVLAVFSSGSFSTSFFLNSVFAADSFILHARKAADADIRFLVGFESEVILLKSTNPVTAVNTHDWSHTNGLPAGSVESLVVKEIANGIQESDIELQMYHAEAAPGQVRQTLRFALHASHQTRYHSTNL